MRSSVIGGNAGLEIVQHITSPIRLRKSNILETGRKNNLQNIKHITQIMKAKYFYILAYKHETDYNGYVSQTKDVA